jgi:transcriptional regulator with XRE-family HTH domain
VIGVKDRIAQVRKQAGINQTDFAEKLNLTKNYISLIENGNRIPSDRTITDICREFNVNEVWLRTGEGDPYQEESRQEQILKFAAQTIKGSDEFRKNFVAMLAKLDVEDWEALAKIFNKLANEQK